jgi:hypothetical protein
MDYPYLPQNINFWILDRHPKLDLWFARISYLSGILLLIAYIAYSYMRLERLLNQ